MNVAHKMTRRRRLAMFIVGGATVVAVAVGGYAVAGVGSNGGTSSSAGTAKVIPFQRGVQGSSKVVGLVPASFSPGTGSIVTGTAANKAKAAALAAYPGGTVNRVVLLSDGEYNV